MSRQADFSRVIWSAMVRLVKPGSRLANSTILMMHLVESSLNLSQSPRSSWTRWSELEFWTHKPPHQHTCTHSLRCCTTGSVQPCLHQCQTYQSLITHLHFPSINWETKSFAHFIHHSDTTNRLNGQLNSLSPPLLGKFKVKLHFCVNLWWRMSLHTLSLHHKYNFLCMTYGGVFSQLAKWRKGFLMSFAHFINQLFKLST